MTRIRGIARHVTRAWAPPASVPLAVLILCLAFATAPHGAGPQLPATVSAPPRLPLASPATSTSPAPATPAADPVDPADPIFDGTALQDIRLTMAPDDWGTLKARVLWNTYYPADFHWGETTLANVAVRSRGSGSRYTHKPSLRIDFNRYVDQKFLKLSSLVLANAVQDPGMLNRRLAMLVFARMGLPASRVVHARVYVNDEYIGLYELIEEPAKAMMGRVFGRDANGKKRDGGYLFEYRWQEGYQWTYPGPSLDLYAALFEAKTHEDDPPADVYGPLADLLRAINESPDPDFVPAVGALLDLEAFVQYLAVEHFIADIDGFLGNWGPNNFYLYRFEGGLPSVLIPWDRDLAFYELYDEVYAGIDRTVLGRRVLEVPQLKQLYLDTLAACARRVSEPDSPGSTVSWMEAELERERAQILAAARADRNKPYPSSRVDEAHTELLAFVRLRSGYVSNQVQRELARTAVTGVR